MDRLHILPPDPIEPVKGPAVWRGRDLPERPDWLYTLLDGEILEIARALEATKERGLGMEAVSAEDFPLPTLAPRLRQAQETLEDGVGSFLLRGWPTASHDLEDNRRAFWGLARHLGTPISQSAKGEKIFHVRDAGLAKEDPRARGPNSSEALHFHCDRCDVIGFLCIHAAEQGGRSYLVSSAAVHNEILRRRPDLLRRLYQGWYYKTHNVDLANDDPWCFQPIFAIEDGRLVSYVLRVLIDRAYELDELPAMTPEQKEALDLLDAVCADPSFHFSFLQEPGDMLFVNNFTNFHSRSAFVDHEDPARRRLLLRIWLSTPNSRSLPPSFAGSFGETAAGAIRGGIHPAG